MTGRVPSTGWLWTPARLARMAFHASHVGSEVMIATGPVSFALAMSLATEVDVAVGAVCRSEPRVKSRVAPIVMATTRSSPTAISNHFRPEPFCGGGPGS